MNLDSCFFGVVKKRNRIREEKIGFLIVFIIFFLNKIIGIIKCGKNL